MQSREAGSSFEFETQPETPLVTRSGVRRERPILAITAIKHRHSQEKFTRCVALVFCQRVPLECCLRTSRPSDSLVLRATDRTIRHRLQHQL
ncbi:hypothetical protein QQF64_006601 [Cirrhinus molitorella]|uniref:Uncharacterized protein n=1 Tax=Cirrhinus molitorella TaxID=172907 RepID=A0ABR3M8B0_9TELE